MATTTQPRAQAMAAAGAETAAELAERLLVDVDYALTQLGKARSYHDQGRAALVYECRERATDAVLRVWTELMAAKQPTAPTEWTAEEILRREG